MNKVKNAVFCCLPLLGRTESFVVQAPLCGIGSSALCSSGTSLSSTILPGVGGITSTDPFLDDLKARLLRSAAGVNRGLSCLERERRDILDIVEQLEERNPNPTPNDGFAEGTSLLTGEWELLFTAALDILSLGLLPGIEVGPIFQNINEDGSEITNIVDIQPKAGPIFERFAGSTSARLKVLASSSVEGDKRVTLSFRSSQYSPKSLLGRDVSSTLPQLKINLPQLPNVGWIDTTYIDDDIRVARAYGGNLFVLARA